MHPVEDIRGLGDNLDCRRVELSVNCDARKKQVDVKLLYNPGDGKCKSVGEKMLEWEPCPSRGWAPRSPVEQPRRTKKNGCDSQKSWGGSICCSLCSVYNSLSHTTLSIKWEVYFSVSARLYCVEYFFACIYVCMYGCLWLYNSNSVHNINSCGKMSRGKMVKAMVCEIVAREFELQSRYYVRFQTNTLRKGMNPLILPAMG